jgi:glycosyltransferase involved in cell wall biosynthesis
MAHRFGFISTYPPTQCGLATFTASLRRALIAGGSTDIRVARLLEAPESPAGGEVVADVVAGDPTSVTAVGALNECDVVIVQHEFGIFGGPDGDEVLGLLAGLTVPTIVVLHTVLTAPSPHQRKVFEAVVSAAGAVVTMTDAARRRLVDGYRVDPGKVRVIAHGAPDAHDVPVSTGARPMVLTWGLLGPGKGIEWGVDAMAQLGDLQPAPWYVVAGQTHPKVRLRDGEAYRESLQQRVDQWSLAGAVRLDGRYLDDVTLAELVAAADVVLLPYDSTEQVTSGVLIEAIAAGKPVVATGFPHAVELLSAGAGIVVPHRDPTAIAAALRTVLTDRGVATAMSRAAAAAAPRLRWSVVADEYQDLAAQLVAHAREVAA